MSFCTIKTVHNGTNIHSTSLAIRIEHGDAENGNEFWSRKIDSHRLFNLIVCDRTCAFWLQIGLWINLYRGFWLLRYTNIQNWFGHSCAWGDHVRRNLQHDSAIARVFFGFKKKNTSWKGCRWQREIIGRKNLFVETFEKRSLAKKNNHWQRTKLERTTFEKRNVRKRGRFWKTCPAEVAQNISENFV